MADCYRHKYSIAIASGTVTAQALGGELDWKNCGVQYRTVAISGATAGDSFLLEVSLDNGTTWVSAQAASTGGTNYVISIPYPVTAMRITKTGTAGAATVTALV